MDKPFTKKKAKPQSKVKKSESNKSFGEPRTKASTACQSRQLLSSSEPRFNLDQPNDNRSQAELSYSRSQANMNNNLGSKKEEKPRRDSKTKDSQKPLVNQYSAIDLPKMVDQSKKDLTQYILDNPKYLKLRGNQRYRGNPMDFVDDQRKGRAQKIKKNNLVPVPLKSQKKVKTKEAKKELYNLQRNIVFCRRMQYGGNDQYYKDAANLAKIKKIQRWWKEMYKIIYIQKMWRGYMMRKQLKDAPEESKLGDFMDKFEDTLKDIYERNGPRNAFHRLFDNTLKIVHIMQPSQRCFFDKTIYKLGDAVRQIKYIQAMYRKLSKKKENNLIKKAGMINRKWCFYSMIYYKHVEEDMKKINTIQEAFKNSYFMRRSSFYNRLQKEKPDLGECFSKEIKQTPNESARLIEEKMKENRLRSAANKRNKAAEDEAERLRRMRENGSILNKRGAIDKSEMIKKGWSFCTLSYYQHREEDLKKLKEMLDANQKSDSEGKDIKSIEKNQKEGFVSKIFMTQQTYKKLMELRNQLNNDMNGVHTFIIKRNKWHFVSKIFLTEEQLRERNAFFEEKNKVYKPVNSRKGFGNGFYIGMQRQMKFLSDPNEGGGKSNMVVQGFHVINPRCFFTKVIYKHNSLLTIQQKVREHLLGKKVLKNDDIKQFKHAYYDDDTLAEEERKNEAKKQESLRKRKELTDKLRNKANNNDQVKKGLTSG
ncbi:MAG: hypothetical protein MJ252_25740, partial [archaeon]|nr:hypothetical protein [archaeon]